MVVFPSRAGHLSGSQFSNVPCDVGDIGPGLSLIVAFLAGCGNVLLTNPIWVVATRMQAHQKKDQVSGPGPLAVAKEIVDESGVRVRPSHITHCISYLILSLFTSIPVIFLSYMSISDLDVAINTQFHACSGPVERGAAFPGHGGKSFAQLHAVRVA